ncbi:MAG TPA: toprim domain-containing protein, partial [Solirubrobacteraceae bacterium]|nr:toprim domain-containing protein [Solirubrobacteraceae bacterium]
MPDATDAEVLAQVVDYYHATLTAAPEALSYLAARRIDSPEAITHFRLGYANRTLGLRLPMKNRRAGAEVRERLERLGVFRSSGHEHLAGSLVVPVISPHGVVTDLYGRKITANLREGTARHLYLPGRHRGVFNEEALGLGEVILCESLIDALSFYSAGFCNVTASYGTSGFGDAHREALVRHRVSRVLLAYDHDAAGDEAASALAGELMASGIECYRVVFPYGQDANDVAVAAASPRDALGALLRDARFLGGASSSAAAPSSAAVPVNDASTSDAPRQDAPKQDAPKQDAPKRSDAPKRAAPLAGGEEIAAPLASPVPPGPRALPAVAAQHDELVIETGPRRWRVRQVPKAPTPGALRVNVMVSCGERFHVDVLDLYAAKA